MVEEIQNNMYIQKILQNKIYIQKIQSALFSRMSRFIQLFIYFILLVKSKDKSKDTSFLMPLMSFVLLQYVITQTMDPIFKLFLSTLIIFHILSLFHRKSRIIFKFPKLLTLLSMLYVIGNMTLNTKNILRKRKLCLMVLTLFYLIIFLIMYCNGERLFGFNIEELAGFMMPIAFLSIITTAISKNNTFIALTIIEIYCIIAVYYPFISHFLLNFSICVFYIKNNMSMKLAIFTGILFLHEIFYCIPLSFIQLKFQKFKEHRLYGLYSHKTQYRILQYKSIFQYKTMSTIFLVHLFIIYQKIKTLKTYIMDILEMFILIVIVILHYLKHKEYEQYHELIETYRLKLCKVNHYIAMIYKDMQNDYSGKNIIINNRHGILKENIESYQKLANTFEWSVSRYAKDPIELNNRFNEIYYIYQQILKTKECIDTTSPNGVLPPIVYNKILLPRDSITVATDRIDDGTSGMYIIDSSLYKYHYIYQALTRPETESQSEDVLNYYCYQNKIDIKQIREIAGSGEDIEQIIIHHKDDPVPIAYKTYIKSLIENPIHREIKKILLAIYEKQRRKLYSRKELSAKELLSITKEIILIEQTNGFSKEHISGGFYLNQSWQSENSYKNKFYEYCSSGFNMLRLHLGSIDLHITEEDVGNYAQQIRNICRHQMSTEVFNAINIEQKPQHIHNMEMTIAAEVFATTTKPRAITPEDICNIQEPRYIDGSYRKKSKRESYASSFVSIDAKSINTMRKYEFIMSEGKYYKDNGYLQQEITKEEYNMHPTKIIIKENKYSVVPKHCTIRKDGDKYTIKNHCVKNAAEIEITKEEYYKFCNEI